LQVHDSLVAQVKLSETAVFEERVYQLAQTVVVPYDNPLIIPIGMKKSDKSWGDAE
jgi:DNA polymerase I-like protein with 3'-5' exonuclease and polymerase domains